MQLTEMLYRRAFQNHIKHDYLNGKRIKLSLAEYFILSRKTINTTMKNIG